MPLAPGSRASQRLCSWPRRYCSADKSGRLRWRRAHARSGRATVVSVDVDVTPALCGGCERQAAVGPAPGPRPEQTHRRIDARALAGGADSYFTSCCGERQHPRTGYATGAALSVNGERPPPQAQRVSLNADRSMPMSASSFFVAATILLTRASMSRLSCFSVFSCQGSRQGWPATRTGLQTRARAAGRSAVGHCSTPP